MYKLILILALSFVKQGATAQMSKAVTGNVTLDHEPEKPNLAVISLKIVKHIEQYSATITNSTLTTSSKNLEKSNSLWRMDDFVCFMLDEQHQMLDTLIIKQALKVRYEYPSADSAIGSTVADLTERDVLLRFSYSEQLKYLRIDRVNAKNELITISLLAFPHSK